MRGEKALEERRRGRELPQQHLGAIGCGRGDDVGKRVGERRKAYTAPPSARTRAWIASTCAPEITPWSASAGRRSGRTTITAFSPGLER
jgi:hypothetical protein